MRHKCLLLTAMLLSGIGLAGLQAQNLFMRGKIGIQNTYALSDIKKLSFSSGNISVAKSTGVTDSYVISDMRYINFTNLITSAPIIEQQENLSKVKLYPNPVTDVLYLQLADTEKQVSVIEILSINGKVLCKETLKHNTGVLKVNLYNLPKGIYLCRINDDTRVVTVKFIKQ